MATKISMPKLSDTMSVGVILEWRKKEGEKISSGDILAEVETDKANMELENFEEGILLKIMIPKGGKVPVGGTIAIVGEKGENIDALVKEAQASLQQTQSAAPATPAAPKAAPTPLPTVAPSTPKPSAPKLTPVTGSQRQGRVKVSPLARRIATAKGLDLGAVLGSGPGGRIVKKDIESAVATGGGRASAYASQLPPLQQKDVLLSQMRQVIARRLLESKLNIPHFYVTVEIDMQKAIELRAALKEAGVGSVSYNDMVIRASALTLRQFPEVNASFYGEFIRQHGEVHIGMAVAIPDGLITPVVRHADQKSLVDIAEETKELAVRAKDRKLKPDEFTGSTFTTSNMGMFGVEDFSAIINPPEAAILAISSIVEKPVVVDGQIQVGQRMKITISCDHRAIDGAIAARFMKELKRLLENPILLIL